jgi:hypothetical protein
VNVGALFAVCESLDVKIRASPGGLNVAGRRQSIARIQPLLIAHKAEILAYLTRRHHQFCFALWLLPQSQR